jgi:hypothetical protein
MTLQVSHEIERVPIEFGLKLTWTAKGRFFQPSATNLPNLPRPVSLAHAQCPAQTGLGWFF